MVLVSHSCMNIAGYKLPICPRRAQMAAKAGGLCPSQVLEADGAYLSSSLAPSKYTKFTALLRPSLYLLSFSGQEPEISQWGRLGTGLQSFPVSGQKLLTTGLLQGPAPAWSVAEELPSKTSSTRG